MEKETEKQVKEKREEKKKIKKRNATRRKVKKNLLIVFRYFVVVLICALLYSFAFINYMPIKREEATVIVTHVSSAEMKQVVVNGRYGSKTDDYIELITSKGEFYFHLPGSPYEQMEIVEIFEDLAEGNKTVSVIVSGRIPDIHSQWTHNGKDEAIEVSDGENVFGSLDEYNDTLKDSLIVFCIIPTVILILAVLFLIFVDLSVSFFELKEKRRLKEKCKKIR